MPKKPLIFFVVFIIVVSATAQEAERKESTEQEGLRGTHRFSLIISHTHLSQGIKENNKRSWIVIPSWGFDYDYWIGDHWALGLQNDLMVETFKVEDQDNTVIERTRPFSSIASVIFKPKEHIGFVAGMGGEFAKEENFAVTRFGIEACREMKKDWEFSISLAYDIKWNAYDSWLIGIGIGKLIKKSR